MDDAGSRTRAVPPSRPRDHVERLPMYLAIAVAAAVVVMALVIVAVILWGPPFVPVAPG